MYVVEFYNLERELDTEMWFSSYDEARDYYNLFSLKSDGEMYGYVRILDDERKLTLDHWNTKAWA